MSGIVDFQARRAAQIAYERAEEATAFSGPISWGPATINNSTPNGFAGWNESGTAVVLPNPGSPESVQRTLATSGLDVPISPDVPSVSYVHLIQAGALTF